MFEFPVRPVFWTFLTFEHGTCRPLGKCKQIWENEPVTGEHRPSEYFWKPNKTQLSFFFFLNNIFVLTNSSIVRFGDLHGSILGPSHVPTVLKSSHRSNHKTLEGQLSRCQNCHGVDVASWLPRNSSCLQFVPVLKRPSSIPSPVIARTVPSRAELHLWGSGRSPSSQADFHVVLTWEAGAPACCVPAALLRYTENETVSKWNDSAY